MFNALPNSKVLHPAAITVITDFFFLNRQWYSPRRMGTIWGDAVIFGLVCLLGGLTVLEKMEMVLTYRMKALEELGQPYRDPGTLEFLSWLLVKSLPLIPSDMWPNGFLS